VPSARHAIRLFTAPAESVLDSEPFFSGLTADFHPGDYARPEKTQPSIWIPVHVRRKFMVKTKRRPIMEQTKELFAKIAKDEDLLDEKVTVKARSLGEKQEQTQGKRKDGGEQLVEATLKRVRGQAFTDEWREFQGTLREVFVLPLDSSANRAIFTAALNATLRSLKRVEKTVHCRDHEAAGCSEEIAACIWDRWGAVPVGLIGLHPAIAKALMTKFGPENVRVCALDPKAMPAAELDPQVRAAKTGLDTVIRDSRVLVVTATTLVTGDFDEILEKIQELNKFYMLYGVTGAGVCQLLGLNRICPRDNRN
jgi:hypothetical protein